MTCRSDTHAPAFWTVSQALSARECEHIIHTSSEASWASHAEDSIPGPIVEQAGNPGLRDEACAALLQDARLALRLYYEVAECLPAAIGHVDLLCVRPKMALVRYREHHHSQRLHEGIDPVTPLVRPIVRRVFTLLLYLNDDFEGGATEFPGLGTAVLPARGRAVIFDHDLDHHEREVTLGEKLVLRATIYSILDFMCTRPLN